MNAVETPVESSETSEEAKSSLTLQDLPTSSESEEMLRVRHSCAHIMAMAVQKLFDGAQCTIGPWIDHGFYYDFAMEEPLTRKSLPRIRKEMQKIIKKKMPFVREEVSVEEARKRIEAIGETYKLEILDSIVERDPDAPITIYHIGEPGEKGSWWDLCAGPHVENTGDIDPNAISLDDVAGAYWRGDENNAQLQRIYGCAFSNATELDAFHNIREEAAKRDHRTLGRELDLFSISDEVCILNPNTDDDVCSSFFALRSSLFALRSSLFALRSSLFALCSLLFARPESLTPSRARPLSPQLRWAAASFSGTLREP